MTRKTNARLAEHAELAWRGVVASVLLVVALPAQRAESRAPLDPDAPWMSGRSRTYYPARDCHTK